MKISLKLSGNSVESDKEVELRALEALILGAKRGDFESRELLVQKFRPLMTTLVEKRASEPATYNKYMDAAKAGLVVAASKYSQSVGPGGFQIFALDFIEKNMDRVKPGGGGGFFSRLFGGG